MSLNPFSDIQATLNAIWNWGAWIIGEVFGAVKSWTFSFWGVGLLVASWIWTVVNWVVNSLAGAIAALDAVVFPSTTSGMPGSLAYAASLGNTFFPLAEGFAMIVALAGVAIALGTYRLVKSWIPTLS